MKGIILAGGKGTRLYPSTLSVPKSCLTVYNKPMIFYPLSILMLAKIKDILIICDPVYDVLYRNLVKNFNFLGLNVEIRHQESPGGIAEALIIGEDFIENDDVCLVLGDNFLFGSDIPEKLESARSQVEKLGGAHIFGFGTKNPKDFGIATVSGNKVVEIEEKPLNPKSNWAVIGVYMYDHNAAEYAKKLEKSKRGELEITDLNRLYLRDNSLSISLLGRGFTWFDMGNHDDMLDASIFVRAVEKNQGYKIACIEEISIRSGLADENKVQDYLTSLGSSNVEYYDYVKSIIREQQEK